MALAPVVKSRNFKGKGSMTVSFEPAGSGDTTFLIVYIRVHYRLLSGANVNKDLIMSLDSTAGEEHDVTLFTAKDRGVGSDANIIFSADELRSPSPWAFHAGDKIKIAWSGGSNIGWGLEIGYDA